MSLSRTPTDLYINDAVNYQLASLASPYADFVTSNTTRVLIIYTGGTIGMKHSADGYIPVSGFLSKTLASRPQFHDPLGIFESGSAAPSGFQSAAASGELLNPRTTVNGTPVIRTHLPALISPASLYGKRTRYSILEYDPLLDSSNMNMTDWVKIATDIEVNYELFDAFIILHGTDTMAYTASALSFMLEELGKTVILTGSQVPLSEVRNDAVENVLGALTIAGHFVIPEVGLYFSHKLYRGNRSSKVDAVDFNAFDSPNIRPLVSVGINIDVSWPIIFRPSAIERFRVHKKMTTDIATLRFFPGISAHTVKSFLAPPVKGAILETFGSGNGPSNNPEILQILKEASDRGVVIVNCTQCRRGLVTDIYATGKALLDVGVIPGYDMTAECALAKLCYLLTKGYGPEECRGRMRLNLRGELTVPIRSQRFTYEHRTRGLINSVMSLLGHGDSLPRRPSIEGVSSRRPDTLTFGEPKRDPAEIASLEVNLVPFLLCQAARIGDIVGIMEVLGEYEGLVNVGDYDGRTPLHVACSEGQIATIQFLLGRGSNVHSRDRFGHSALWDAASSSNREAVQLLRDCGAHFSEEEQSEVVIRLTRVVALDDAGTLAAFSVAGADLGRRTFGKLALIHLATLENRLKCLRFLVDESLARLRATPVSVAGLEATHLLDSIDLEPRDVSQKTPLAIARELGHQEAARILAEGIDQTRALIG
ncbi:asparaginase-domain-containing protein [Polychytrium aggregatum]|uniref:asparaginase-domain-containing protein n=1 Tax=Polychytrium aggregatum TaxID=110093 RepID=UPI0022FDF862|nr:asparaginase-domain-containing protein [Polychytrium aggregatum]KAI9205643.1 asparaginase-domain-containing protein [Polychytrium aggregatum]